MQNQEEIGLWLFLEITLLVFTDILTELQWADEFYDLQNNLSFIHY